MSADKIAEEKSATPGKDWHRPSGPHAGLTDSIPNAPQSSVAKSSTAFDSTGNGYSKTASTPAQSDSVKEKEVGEPAGLLDNVQKKAYQNVDSI